MLIPQSNGTNLASCFPLLLSLWADGRFTVSLCSYIWWYWTMIQEDQCLLSNSSSLRERIKTLNLSLKELTAKVSTFLYPLSKEVSKVIFLTYVISSSHEILCLADGSTRSVDFTKPSYRPGDEAKQPGARAAPWWGSWLVVPQQLIGLAFASPGTVSVRGQKWVLLGTLNCFCMKRLWGWE